MTTRLEPRDHQVVEGARALVAELTELMGATVWAMSTAQAETALLTLTEARSRLDALTMKVLRHAETVDAGLDGDAVTTTAWWAQETRTTRAAAHRTRKLAEALDRHDDVAEQLEAGALRTDQAQVIVDAVDDLPPDVAAWVPITATQFLLEKAREHDAKALRVLGRRVLEVIDPDAADAEEARRLDHEEADAQAAASLTAVDDGHGQVHGRFTIPSLHWQILRKHLDALLSPARHTAPGCDGSQKAQGEAERPPLTRHRMGQALLEYLETRPTDTIPSSGGGVAATVVVTMQLDTLMGGLTAASLDTGGRLSAGQARRLACRAGIIPAVLDGPSVVLDLGRRRRLHTEHQRIAMAIRDHGCTAHGCDTPPGLCHAHHDTPWARGGHTTVTDGRLLCPRHHRRIHDPTYHHTLDKHGKVRFTRRT